MHGCAIIRPLASADVRMDAVSGNGFDLEGTLGRLESKIGPLSRKVTLGERRLEARLELLRVDLIEAFLEADRATLNEACTGRDQSLHALRTEVDELRHRLGTVEQSSGSAARG
jgi:hypothetical protein